MNKPSKKRPKQHRVDTDGLKLFENALPNTKEASFIFSTEQNDYGIDGGLQVVLNEEHTGEFFKVQVKSTDSPSYIENGKYLSLSLDIASAYFLIEEVKSATALIVVDTKTKKVFWHPIQTDPSARTALEKGLDQKSVTIHVNIENELRPDNYEALYNYLKQAQLRLSQKEILQTKTNKTLDLGMKFLSEIEQKTLDIEGFTPHFRQWDGPITKGTIFTVGYGGKRAIDFVPSADFRPELAPKLNMMARFSTKTKEGREKAEAFKKLIETGRGSVELSDENIGSFEAISGDTVLHDKTYTGGGVRLNISPSIQKHRQTIFINNGAEELENEVEIWFEDGKVHIESIAGQVLRVATSFELNNKLSTTFNVRTNNSLFKNASHELRLMDFFRGKKQLEISFLDGEGFKRKLFGGTLNGNVMFTDENYEFVKALTEIERVSGVPIPYPLPDTLKRNDINNVFWVHKLLLQGNVNQSMTVNFTLKETPPETPKKGGALMLSQSPPEIYLFDKPYVLEGFRQEIKGVITDLRKTKTRTGNLKYKVRIDTAEISILKQEQPKQS